MLILSDAAVLILSVRQHSSTDTVKIYAELADQVADAEIRAARRRRESRR